MKIIRSYRKRHGLTITDFAEKIGVSRPLLGLIEKGERGITPAVAKNIEIATDGEISRLELLYPEEYGHKEHSESGCKSA